jgi:hypothetical protein
MHTEGIDEPVDGEAPWLVRLECRQCGLRIGAVAEADEAFHLVDRFMWSDEARRGLDRLPPWISPLISEGAENLARERGQKIVTVALFEQSRCGGGIAWSAEAEQRLQRIPAPVRAMARVELERAAQEKGEHEVTPALMEEVKARYFGLFGTKPS